MNQAALMEVVYCYTEGVRVVVQAAKFKEPYDEKLIKQLKVNFGDSFHVVAQGFS